MKAILLTFCLCSLLTTNTYSQKVSFKFLSGSWEMKGDTTIALPTFFFTFIDTGHVYMTSPQLTDTVKFTFTIDTSGTLTLLKGIGKESATRTREFYWIVKRVDENDFKIQGEDHLYIDLPDNNFRNFAISTTWNDNENPQNTLAFVRKN